MPLPARLAQVNKRVTNKAMRPLASRLGGFAVLRHTGRTSGKVYETPLNAWVRGEEIVVPLTYGPDVDWLKNASAAQESTFVISGEELRVGRPSKLRASEGYERMPRLVRLILAALNVDAFVVFSTLQSDQRINTLPDSSD